MTDAMAAAAERLKALAASVNEDTEAEATTRLLELVAVADDTDILHAMLVAEGARSVLLATEETP